MNFPGSRPMYTGGIHVIKLFVFLLFIGLLLQESLNKKPRKVEGNFFLHRFYNFTKSFGLFLIFHSSLNVPYCLCCHFHIFLFCLLLK